MNHEIIIIWSLNATHKEKNEKIETLKNVVTYIYTPILMWSGFVWIRGKSNFQDIQDIDRETHNECKY